jgi:predicted RNA-binding protein with PUA-like domain
MSERFWLVKSEPEVFSIDDLAKAKSSGWEGVRNFQARNTMRDDMKPGALVLFYHSNAKPSGIAGLAKVKGAPRADPTQFDPTSEYFDATSPREAPRWVMVNLVFVERFTQVLSLETLKADKALAGMPLLQKGQRLSVQSVSPAHFAQVLKLSKSKTRVR